MTVEDGSFAPLDTAEMERLAEKVENGEDLTVSEQRRIREQATTVAAAAEDMNKAIAEAFAPMIEDLGSALEEIGSAFADAVDDIDWEEQLVKPLTDQDPATIRVVMKQRKEKGMNMVHRLRDWERGETVWGYDIQVEDGATSGKTFQRDSSLLDEDAPYVREVERKMKDALEHHKSPAVGVVWVGTIEKVTTEAHDHSDSGEPPLKHASLTDVVVKRVERTE